MSMSMFMRIIFYFSSEEVDRTSQLRTRAMRERDEKNPTGIYRFTLLRVKFPDGFILQGKDFQIIPRQRYALN